jgi:hypothetical protein
MKRYYMWGQDPLETGRWAEKSEKEYEVLYPLGWYQWEE